MCAQGIISPVGPTPLRFPLLAPGFKFLVDLVLESVGWGIGGSVAECLWFFIAENGTHRWNWGKVKDFEGEEGHNFSVMRYQFIDEIYYLHFLRDESFIVELYSHRRRHS